MPQDSFEYRGLHRSRRTLAAPVEVELQPVLSALADFDPNLPLSSTLDMDVRRQMIQGVEPQLQAT